jgi:DNA-directed RNA polymerase subunit RPC12/RpoP
MPFDEVTYLRCADCGEFVIEGEAQAHEQGCGTERLVCRVCGDRVSMKDLREHLVGHNPNAEHLEPGEVRDQFAADDSEFLGSLTGPIKFGPGWDKPLPPEDWEALRRARACLVVMVHGDRAPTVLGPMSEEMRQEVMRDLSARYAHCGLHALDIEASGTERVSATVKRYEPKGD